MKKYFLTSFTLFSFISFYFFTGSLSHASTTWRSFCAKTSSNSLIHHANYLQATNYTIQIPDHSNVFLKSQQFTANQSLTNLSEDQLQKVADITSTGLLTIFLNHQINDCNKNYYISSMTPILKQMKANEQLTFIWKNVLIKNQNQVYQADKILLRIKNISERINLKLSFSGLNALQNSSKPNILFPNQGEMSATTSLQNYPLILAAASGNNENDFYDLSLPLQINSLTVKNNTTNITATGNTVLDRELHLKSANGKVTVSNMNQLIKESSNAKISNIKTALILAKFAGRSVKNNTLEWDINWQENLFKVNNVPIPIW